MIFATHYLRLQLGKLSRQNIVTVMYGLVCFSVTTQVQSSRFTVQACPGAT